MVHSLRRSSSCSSGHSNNHSHEDRGQLTRLLQVAAMTQTGPFGLGPLDRGDVQAPVPDPGPHTRRLTPVDLPVLADRFALELDPRFLDGLGLLDVREVLLVL